MNEDEIILCVYIVRYDEESNNRSFVINRDKIKEVIKAM